MYKNIIIIIPTYNRKSLLKKVLSQIFYQIEKLVSDFRFKIIIVVDGSTDGTFKMLTTEFPDVHIIIGNGDWWYTRSMNEGFKYAINNLQPDFVLALNDDVVLADDYLEQIVIIAKENFANTIVGSIGITHGLPHRIVTSGNNWRNKCLGTYSHQIYFLRKVEPYNLNGLHPSITLPGRGMLIPVTILKKLNFFDERFKQYHSDSDFTLRALKVGFQVKISWDAKIFVHLEKTSSTTSFLNKSFKQLLKSFFIPVSRNYLPSKSRFVWRHGFKICYPLRLAVFIGSTFLNLAKNVFK